MRSSPVDAGTAGVRGGGSDCRRLRFRPWLRRTALTVALAWPVTVQAEHAFGSAIADTQARVVKIYGAAVGAVKGYGAGVLVSPQGHVVTVLSALLEASQLRVVLPDGTTALAQVLRRDEIRQLALLQCATPGVLDGLPYYALTDRPADYSIPATPELPGLPAVEVSAGDWILAAGNPFKVADGPEPVSLTAGVVSGRISLAARVRARDHPYTGEVILTDVIVSTPGSAGGAIVDIEGRFAGLIGRPVLSRKTNTWLNYALPPGEVAAFLRGEPAAAPPVRTTAGPTLVELGIRLLDLGGRKRLAYVERVRPGSTADRAGVRANDLVLAVNTVRIEVAGDVATALREIEAGEPVTLTIKRGEEILTLPLEPPEVQP